MGHFFVYRQYHILAAVYTRLRVWIFFWWLDGYSVTGTIYTDVAFEPYYAVLSPPNRNEYVPQNEEKKRRSR